MNKLAELTIFLTGSTYLETSTQEVRKKPTNVRIQVGYERGGPLIQYQSYEGKDHFVSLQRKKCSKVSPIYETTWNHWTSTLPSESALRQMFPGVKSRNQRIISFNQSSDYSKIVGHCYDLVADQTGNQRPSYGMDFNLEVYQYS
jgi:hypothetical protein